MYPASGAFLRAVQENTRVKESELIGKIHSAVYHQCRQRGYAAPADVLTDIGVLPKGKWNCLSFLCKNREEIFQNKPYNN